MHSGWLRKGISVLVFYNFEVILISVQKVGPLAAAILNSTFIQGFELDDWHSEAPLHSNSILLPALFAAAEQTASKGSTLITGSSVLLATIAGYETGPRVGLGLYGIEMLSRGWHSGAVFGPVASAVAVSKLLGLSVAQIEDAVGIACTQACGLMSAQFESDVKRMQHGFASRNWLFAALLAKENYIGIKQVIERPYGGYLAAFGQGSGQDPEYKPEEVCKALGEAWKIDGIRVKPYAAMAGTHGTIDCMARLQEHYPKEMADFPGIKKITIELPLALFKHGGWDTKRPVTATGAQMSNAYAAAVQLVDKQVLAAQFRHDLLDRDVIWSLVEKVTCVRNDHLQLGKWSQKATVELYDGRALVEEIKAPKGIDPPISNEEIVKKWRLLADGVIDAERRDKIENLTLRLDEVDDISVLTNLLAGKTRNVIA